MCFPSPPKPRGPAPAPEVPDVGPSAPVFNEADEDALGIRAKGAGRRSLRIDLLDRTGSGLTL